MSAQQAALPLALPSQVSEADRLKAEGFKDEANALFAGAFGHSPQSFPQLVWSSNTVENFALLIPRPYPL